MLGPGAASSDALAVADEVGAEIARQGAILVCGGLGGVMEAAARGAKLAGGLTVGIVPGIEAGEANAFIDVPVDQFGWMEDESYQVHDLLTEERYLWQGKRNFVRLDPGFVPAAIFHLRRRIRTERDFDYFL